jgi:hypothetical protein
MNCAAMHEQYRLRGKELVLLHNCRNRSHFEAGSHYLTVHFQLLSYIFTNWV